MSVTKAIKSVVFTVQAAGDHNALKIKNVLRWLKSGHEVKVQISGKEDRSKAIEAISKELEKEVGSGARLMQRVVKPTSTQFILRPTSEAANFVIEDGRTSVNIDKTLEEITANKDIFSDDFEQELADSIKEEKAKSKKKK